MVQGQSDSALPLLGCVMLFKLHNFSEPHLLHLHSGILSLLYKTQRVLG